MRADARAAASFLGLARALGARGAGHREVGALAGTFVRIQGAGVHEVRELGRLSGHAHPQRGAGEGARTSRTERTRQAKERRRGSRVRAHTGPELAHVVHALSVYEGPEWTVGEIRLVASELGEGRSGGALHTTVERHPLSGA